MQIGDYFEQQGAGSPIVFVHGSYATNSTWRKMVEHLAQNHHCISIKLPGHGGAPAPADFSNPEIQTELSVVEGVVNELTDQPIHLVGHSYGGVVALSQALKGSLNLSQLTLFEPVAVWVLDTLKDAQMSDCVQTFLAQYRSDVAQSTPYVCGQVIDFWGGEGAFEPLPEFIKESMQSLVRDNIRHWDVCSSVSSSLSDLQACHVPTRLVCGGQSNQVAHAISDHLCEALPNSNKIVIEGASHFLVTSHVKECLAALTDLPVFQY